MQEVDGLKAIDKYTLKVTLKSPTPFFLGLLSHYSTWPVHKDTVLKHGDIDDRNGEWTRFDLTHSHFHSHVFTFLQVSFVSVVQNASSMSY